MNMQEWIAKGKEKLLSFGIKQWGMLLLAGICCLVIVFPVGKEKKGYMEEGENKNTEGQQEVYDIQADRDYVSQLESRLEDILSGVKDVGQVKVMITAGSI